MESRLTGGGGGGDFRRQFPPPVADFVKSFYSAVNVGREKDILQHYERGWKDISARFFQAEPWPTLGDISGSAYWRGAGRQQSAGRAGPGRAPAGPSREAAQPPREGRRVSQNRRASAHSPFRVPAPHLHHPPLPSPLPRGAVVSNRTFLVLYRLLYYKHLLLRLSSEERPAALSTYFEAWFAYKEFFDLALGLDGTSAAAELVLPSAWVHDIIFDFVYFHERFVRRRTVLASGAAAVAGGGFGGDGEDGALSHGEGGEDSSSRAFGLSPAASIAAAAGTAVSDEELSQVWLVRCLLLPRRPDTAPSARVPSLPPQTHPLPAPRPPSSPSSSDASARRPAAAGRAAPAAPRHRRVRGAPAACGRRSRHGLPRPGRLLFARGALPHLHEA